MTPVATVGHFGLESVVLLLSYGFQMVWVCASRRFAFVVDVEAFGYLSVEENVARSMGEPDVPLAPDELAVTGGHYISLPDPAAILIDLYLRQEARQAPLCELFLAEFPSPHPWAPQP